MKWFNCLFVIFLSVSVLPSQTSLLLINAKEVDENQYNGFKGTPMIFKDWTKMTLFPVGEESLSEITGNYNAYENLVEVRYENKHIYLPQRRYPKVEYTTKDGDKVALIYSVHTKFKNEYVSVHYQGDNFWIIEQHRVVKKELDFNPPGGTVKIKKFVPKSVFYILKDGELTSFKLKDKDIYSEFGHKNEIKGFLKKNKNKLKKLSDAIPLFIYLDEEGWI